MITREFKIKITEILERTVSVEALNKDEAIEKIKLKYDAENIILDASDYKTTTFKTVKRRFS